MGISQLTRVWVREKGLAFRRRRMQQLCALMGVDASTRVLDVGGTPLNWTLLDVRPRVTLLNNRPEMEEGQSWFEYVNGDARQLPFGDASFDLVFSNSVIEHVGSREDQRRFAEEVRRVGRCYWVQTPNRWYPVEAHLLTPLVHLLPARAQRPLVRFATLWDLIERPSPDRRKYYIEHYLNCVRLLTASELSELFPGGRLLRERHWGLTKSLIVAKTA
jgi:hypothetical protein